MKTQIQAKFVFMVVTAFLAVSPLAHAYYDPGVHRWIKRDPIAEAGGLNLYAVALNEPISGLDVWGLDCWRILSDSTFGHEYFVGQDGTNFWYTDLMPGKGLRIGGAGLICKAEDTSPKPWSFGDPSGWNNGEVTVGGTKLNVKAHIKCSEDVDKKILDYVKEEIPKKKMWQYYHVKYTNCKTYTWHLFNKVKEMREEEKKQKETEESE